MKIGIALMYGIFNPSNTGYKKYLEFVSSKIHEENFDKLILCGGFTDPNNPDTSEALSAKNYLKTITDNFDNYVLEEISLTTNQNLEFASEMLDGDDELIVICDSIRLAKIIWASQHYLLKLNKEQVYKNLFEYAKNRNFNEDFIHKNLKIIPYEFIDRSKEQAIEQTFASLLEVFAIYNNDFEHMGLTYRKKEFGLE